MGVDIADFNNDGLLDIFQVDMDSPDNYRAKANMASMNPQLFWSTVNSGFHYQYMHNCLQLNTGNVVNNSPTFSNVSRLSGTSSTDWSWGPLFGGRGSCGSADRSSFPSMDLPACDRDLNCATTAGDLYTPGPAGPAVAADSGRGKDAPADQIIDLCLGVAGRAEHLDGIFPDPRRRRSGCRACSAASPAEPSCRTPSPGASRSPPPSGRPS